MGPNAGKVKTGAKTLPKYCKPKVEGKRQKQKGRSKRHKAKTGRGDRRKTWRALGDEFRTLLIVPPAELSTVLEICRCAEI